VSIIYRRLTLSIQIRGKGGIVKNTRKNLAQGVKLFKKRTVRLKARESHTVGLGAYPAVRYEKDFAITCSPEIGNMLGTSLEMVAIPGSDRFMGLYHLQNLGDKDCDVTITARTIEGSSRGRD
jgi:hypothetical protein